LLFVFIVAKTAISGRDALKKTSGNAHLLDMNKLNEFPCRSRPKLENCRSATISESGHWD